MYKLSVIMPVYNNEDTLRLAIDTILNQTVFDFELILIDDGSTDSSAQICIEYAEREPLLIEVIHQKKVGFSSARNKGLHLAKGSYVYFADAQNIFLPRMLEENFKLAEEKNAELVVFGFNQLNRNTQESIERIPLLPFLPSKARFRNHYRNFHYFYPYELCNKLYQTQFLRNQNLVFNNHYPEHGDAFFNIDVYRNLDTVVFNRKIYCQNNAIDHATFQQYDQDMFVKTLHLIDYLKDLLNDWQELEEYQDLIVREYYNLVENRIRKLIASAPVKSSPELEKKIKQVLTEKKIKEILYSEELIPINGIYEKILWNNFRNQDTRAIIRNTNRKNKVDKLTGNIKRKFKKMFNE